MVKGASISVLITAYNRKKYLVEAIESVLKQTLPRENYQIVVIKNFDYKPVDELCLRKGILCVKSTEESMGAFILKGLKACENSIIAFLEDDDLWEPDKLKRISDFLEENKIHYYHNSILPVDEKGNTLNPKTFEVNGFTDTEEILVLDSSDNSKIGQIGKYFPDFNLSSIVIDRTKIGEYIEILPKIETAVDSFFFLLSIFLRERIALDPKQLTLYRHHIANQSGTTGKVDQDYLDSLYTFTKRGLRAYSEIRDALSPQSSRYIRRILERRVRFTRILNSIQNPSTGRIRTLKYLLKMIPYAGVFHRSLNLKAIGLGLLYMISPNRSRRLLARNM